MRAIQIFAPGGPEVLTEVELPTPAPGPGQVRVKAEAIGVGRPDVLVRKGIYKWMPPLPTIPGSEMAGRVDALGSGAPASLLGQRVLVSGRELPSRAGCYAEYICVPAEALFILPESINPVDAVSLPNLQFVNAVWQCNGGRPVRSVLIPGIGGGVGAIMTRFARARGIQVIGSTTSPEKIEFARGNGVSHILETAPTTWPERVMEWTQGQGVDLAVDQLGGDSLIACLRSLAPMGMVVSINAITGIPQENVFAEMRALVARSPALRNFSMHTMDSDVIVRRGLMQQAIEQMACGEVTAPPAQLLKLSEIQTAHRLLDTGKSMGKIVVQP